MQCRQSTLSYTKQVKLHKNPDEQVVATRFIIRNLVGQATSADVAVSVQSVE